jgi:serine/threonine-protein phosphatase 2A activator
MRKIQSTYWLEPAGSHGVWGLDDYHFLPFVFGSAQLVPHRHLRPKSIHDAEITGEFGKHYMYFACIEFINSIKTASLRWHSPMLDDISSVKTWSKVNEGMLKMYKAEVLSKLPIAQHIFFGSLLSFPSAKPGEEEEEEADGAGVDACGHSHPHGPSAPGGGELVGEGQAAGWGDCCGIPIPSVFAAAEEEKEKARKANGVAVGGAVKRVPFD